MHYNLCVDISLDELNEEYLFTATAVEPYHCTGLIEITSKTRIKFIDFNNHTEQLCTSQKDAVSTPIYKHISLKGVTTDVMNDLLTFGEKAGTLCAWPLGNEDQYACICGTVNCFSEWTVHRGGRVEVGCETTYYSWETFLKAVSPQMIRIGAFYIYEIIPKTLSMTRVDKIKYATLHHYKRLARTFGYMHKNCDNASTVLSTAHSWEETNFSICESWHKALLYVSHILQSHTCTTTEDEPNGRD